MNRQEEEEEEEQESHNFRTYTKSSAGLLEPNTLVIGGEGFENGLGPWL